MDVDNTGTSEYWRKILKIDEESGQVLQKFNYAHKFLRPIFFFFFGIFCRFYLRAKVFGIENLSLNPPYIIAPNHTSSLDYGVVAWAIGKKARNNLFVLATKFFYDIGFTRFVMKIAANVQRFDVDKDFLTGVRTAAQILKQGKSVYINPEGTRSETGELLPFRPGVGMLAAELKVPIVPVYIKGLHKALPPGKIFPKPSKAEIHFGEPINLDKYLPKLKTGNAYYVYKEITEELRNKVMSMK